MARSTSGSSSTVSRTGLGIQVFSFTPLRRSFHAPGASFPRSPAAGAAFRLDAPGNLADTCSKSVLCATPFYTPWRRIEQIESPREKPRPGGVAAKDETIGEETR